jgi:hypothetical protein
MTAPAIYAPRLGPPLLSWSYRLFAIGLALGCLAVLVVAALTPPSGEGVGTHETLGLNPCQFLARTGLPCPSCGMTTSFSWFARGHLLASLWVQPMGMLMAGVAAAVVWIGLYVGLTGRPVYRLLRFVPAKYYLFPLFLTAILAWAWKIYAHLRGFGGWSGT